MDLTLTNNELALRHITDADKSMLFDVYSSTKEEELELTNWEEEQKQAFLIQQFEAQHHHYKKYYKGAHFWAILIANKIIGRLYLDSNFENNGVRIIDITLLPDYRNKGIGKGILEDIINYAKSLGKPLSIHVESFNPAKMLYKRLGFKMRSETNNVYHLMVWAEETKAT